MRTSTCTISCSKRILRWSAKHGVRDASGPHSCRKPDVPHLNSAPARKPEESASSSASRTPSAGSTCFGAIVLPGSVLPDESPLAPLRALQRIGERGESASRTPLHRRAAVPRRALYLDRVLRAHTETAGPKGVRTIHADARRRGRHCCSEREILAHPQDTHPTQLIARAIPKVHHAILGLPC